MVDTRTPKQKEKDEQIYRDNMKQFEGKRGCMVYFLIGFGAILCAFFGLVV